MPRSRHARQVRARREDALDGWWTEALQTGSKVAWTKRVEKAPPFFTLRDAEARRSRRVRWRRVDNASLVHALLPDGDAWVKGAIFLLPLFAGRLCPTFAARSLYHKVT